MGKTGNTVELKDRLQWIPIAKLIKAPWNYKLDEPEKLQKLLTEIKVNGILQTSVVRELGNKFEIIDGNHRYDVYTELAIPEAPCFNLGRISIEDAMRRSIELNELRFTSDNLKLADIIKKLSIKTELKALSSTMAFSEEQLLDYTKLIDFNWDQFQKSTTGRLTEQFKISIPVTKKLYEKWMKIIQDKDPAIVLESALNALEAHGA